MTPGYRQNLAALSNQLLFRILFTTAQASYPSFLKMPKRKWTYGASRSKRRARNVHYGGLQAMEVVPAAGAGFLRRGMPGYDVRGTVVLVNGVV